MRKFLFFKLFVLFCISSYSQTFFVKLGKNFSNFDYRYKDSQKTIMSSLQTDTGNNYEVGFAFPFTVASRFSYQLGVSLDELNSIVGNPEKAVTYKTEYLGFKNRVVFSIVKAKNFTIDSTVGFSVMTIVYGKENIEGVIHDIKDSQEFKGLFFRPFIGGQLKLIPSKAVAISLGYDYNYSGFNLNSLDNQALFIANYQYNVGLYFTIDKSVKDKIYTTTTTTNQKKYLSN